MRIHIILPNRIGDSILTLPALLCLNQLYRKYPDRSVEITVFSHVRLVGLFRSLGLEPFHFKHFDTSCKLLSWIDPPDKAFFLSTTSKNIGYRSKTSYGLPLSNKKLVRYTHAMPYLDGARLEDTLPKDLLNFLRTGHTLTAYSWRHFGLCLELGFSVEQIKDEFKFDSTNVLRYKREGNNAQLPASDYVVFCMEAAYNRRHAGHRRWHTDGFFDLAAKLHADHGIESVFVGLQDQPQLPRGDYLKDLRRKLTLEQIVDVIDDSRGFIGNDSGLLHIANLLRIKTIGTYPGNAGEIYWPLYPQFNKVFLTEQQPVEFYPFLGRLISQDNWPG